MAPRWWRRRSSAQETAPSLYDFIVSNTDPATGQVKQAAWTLPDEEPATPGKIRFMAGALDGIGTHHASFTDDQDKVDAVVDLTAKIARKGRQHDEADLKALLAGTSVLSFIDQVGEKLAKAEIRTEPYLRPFAERLVRRGTHRAHVKYGLALLGFMRSAPHRDLLERVGAHEEFALFAAVALSNLLDEPQRTDALFTLAQRLQGWGRIQMVERLVPTQRADIKEWLLAGGFRNAIMDEYLAWIAAEHGGLLSALQRPQLSRELFDAFADLLNALICGGPAQDIADYKDGFAAVRTYLDRLAEWPDPGLKHLIATDAIHRWLAESGPRKPVAAPDQVDEARALAGRILDRPHWRTTTEQALQASDDASFWEADRASRILGIDAYEAHFRRAEARPAESHLWAQLMQATTKATIDRTLALADRLVTPQASELAHKNNWATDHLEWIAQGLEKYPGRGLPYLLGALQHPGLRARRAAATALANWSVLPAAAGSALRTALAKETDDSSRKAMEEALARHDPGRAS